MRMQVVLDSDLLFNFFLFFTLVSFSFPLQSPSSSPSHLLFLPPSWFVWGCCRQDDKIVLVIIFITVCTLFLSPSLHFVSCNLMISPSLLLSLSFSLSSSTATVPDEVNHRDTTLSTWRLLCTSCFVEIGNFYLRVDEEYLLNVQGTEGRRWIGCLWTRERERTVHHELMDRLVGGSWRLHPVCMINYWDILGTKITGKNRIADRRRI